MTEHQTHLLAGTHERGDITVIYHPDSFTLISPLSTVPCGHVCLVHKVHPDVQIFIEGKPNATYTHPPHWEVDTVACCGYSIHVLYPVRTNFIHNPDTVWIVVFDSRGRLPA